MLLAEISIASDNYFEIKWEKIPGAYFYHLKIFAEDDLSKPYRKLITASNNIKWQRPKQGKYFVQIDLLDENKELISAGEFSPLELLYNLDLYPKPSNLAFDKDTRSLTWQALDYPLRYQIEISPDGEFNSPLVISTNESSILVPSEGVCFARVKAYVDEEVFVESDPFNLSCEKGKNFSAFLGLRTSSVNQQSVSRTVSVESSQLNLNLGVNYRKAVKWYLYRFGVAADLLSLKDNGYIFTEAFGLWDARIWNPSWYLHFGVEYGSIRTKDNNEGASSYLFPFVGLTFLHRQWEFWGKLLNTSDDNFFPTSQNLKYQLEVRYQFPGSSFLTGILYSHFSYDVVGKDSLKSSDYNLMLGYLF